MATVTGDDVERMTSALFIEKEWRSRSSSRFWVLLLLAAIIATAGVVSDSTATVIGAMIVAPLMTPILGVALGLVLAERSPLLRSMLLVLLGALLVIAVGFLISMLVHPADDYLANSQVQARINPRLIDLVAALATGMVGAFALVRSDISDTLPGVAIAISLVPPLAVVGCLLEVQRYDDAAHAFLLFATNVAAIIATGTLVLLLYRVRETAQDSGLEVGRLTGWSLVTVAAMLVVVIVPLALGSASVANDQSLIRRARPIAEAWATAAGWDVTQVDAQRGSIVVTALGPPPEVKPEQLRQELNAAGLADASLTIRLVVGGTRVCPANGTTCQTTAEASAQTS
ncbi:MAG TPA: TIGR00341 family protein [Candidatus Nanopelagicales bacterium]|nr:TIGR00341 family protein [Candidatus Nanopelagicales bacterium]